MTLEEPSLGAVHVFGPFELRDAKGEAVRLPARSAATLTAYLALHWRGVPRHETAGTLWPGSEHEQARAALRTAVRRVRQTVGERAIVDEEGSLRLTLDSDALQAARFRRARRRSADADEALTAAKSEWAIVRESVLSGWDDEWIEPLRDDARLLANECGTALARLYEEVGAPQEALDVLDGVLRAVPYQADALEHAMRLENALHGRERALARAADARASLPPGVGVILPGSVRRLERALRDEASGYLPPPHAFTDGADLTLIGHMLEGSLRQGGTAALALLAEQAFSPLCLRHPHRTLDLLRKAIALSEGFGPERLAVFVAAVNFAMSIPEPEALHELCDVLIANFPPDHRMHNGAILAKGAAYFEACELGSARRYTDRAIAECLTEERRLVAAAQLGIIDFHELRMEAASGRLRAAHAALTASDREDRDRNLATIEGAFCCIHAVQGEFEAAQTWGEAAIARSGPEGVTHVLISAYLGFAYLSTGRSQEGLDRLRHALRENHRKRMVNGFATALDITAMTFARLGHASYAGFVLDASNAYRRTQGTPRTPAILHFLAGAGLDPIASPAGPLRLQSPGALSEWLGEALERALSGRAAI